MQLNLKSHYFYASEKPITMRNIIIILSLFAISFFAHGQDTFSIVAIDTITGEIGSAGASCIDDNAIAGGAIIISDVLPGRGAIHTQSYWLASNQQNARERMLLGDSPQEIIDWLEANDTQNLPGRRQYGIVDTDIDGNPRSAAYTGVNCLNWKGHITGVNYSIQGNILLGQEIVDNIEAGFLNTDGTLADKLMAALQGANIPGADTRCLSEGVSSLSAFIRVAQPDNDDDSLYLDLNVPETPFGVEPIDVLQEMYDEWKQWVGVPNQNEIKNWYLLQHSNEFILVNKQGLSGLTSLQLFSIQGNLLVQDHFTSSSHRIQMTEFPTGMYILMITDNQHKKQIIKILK